MKNTVRTAIAVLLLFSGHAVSAQDFDPAACIQQVPAMFTCYAPGAEVSAKGVDIEGGFETSRPGLSGRSIPSTLDDVREGRAKVVTLAGHPDNYGKYYNLGTVRYQSVKGGVYTLDNVVGYVHDTGCAFWEDGRVIGKQRSCCAKFNTCDSVYRHFDIAHGDFRGSFPQGALEDAQSGPACGKMEKAICQIGGPLTTPPTVTYMGPGRNEQTMMSLGNMGANGLRQGVQGVQSAIGNQFQSGSGLSTSAIQNTNTQTSTTGSPEIFSSVEPRGFLLVYPKAITRGTPFRVSWGVSGGATQCGVTMQVDSGETQRLGTARSGTRIIATSKSSLGGVRTFVLSCTKNGATVLEKKVTAQLR